MIDHRSEQQFAFVRSPDGVRIAYATYGPTGGVPLVFELTWISQEQIWSLPQGRAFLTALGHGRRLITYDRRGMGASDREVPSLDFECEVADLATLVDHLGFQRFDLFSMFGTVAIQYAAEQPERVDSLILFAPSPGFRPYSPDVRETIVHSWSLFTRSAASVICPSGPPDLQRWFSDAIRQSATPDYIAKLSSRQRNLSDECERIRARTLVLHGEGIQEARIKGGRATAALIPNARFVSYQGDGQHPLIDYAMYMPIAHEFLGVSDPHSTLQAGTAVILFTDIADSTALTERMGDAAFRAASSALDERLRAAIREAGGSPVEGKVLGDGVMATFASAREAIDAAVRCRALSAASELRLHLGIHAGDVIREPDNVYGGAVNIASRICTMSEPGEILVSDVVRGMARSSAGVAFEDRGEQEMKGVGEPVRVYAVRTGDA